VTTYLAVYLAVYLAKVGLGLVFWGIVSSGREDREQVEALARIGQELKALREECEKVCSGCGCPLGKHSDHGFRCPRHGGGYHTSARFQ
jgi:hypothetical protein